MPGSAFITRIRSGVVAGWALADQYAAKKGDASETVMASSQKIDGLTPLQAPTEDSEVHLGTTMMISLH